MLQNFFHCEKRDHCQATAAVVLHKAAYLAALRESAFQRSPFKTDAAAKLTLIFTRAASTPPGCPAMDTCAQQTQTWDQLRLNSVFRDAGSTAEAEPETILILLSAEQQLLLSFLTGRRRKGVIKTSSGQTWLLFSAWLFRLESGKWMWQPVSSITPFMLLPPLPMTWECSVWDTSIFSVTLLL